MTLLFVPVFARLATLLDGFGITVFIALIAIVLSMAVGLGLAFARRSGSRPVRC